MRKLFYLCVSFACIAICVSCDLGGSKLAKSQAENDSLMTVVLRQQNDLADLVTILNDATSRLDEINGQISINGSDDSLLGQRDRLIQQLETIKQRIVVKEQQLEELQKKYKNVLGENKELKKSIDRMKNEISTYQERIVEFENTVAAQREEIGQLNTTLASTKEQLAEKTATAAAQQEVIGNQDKMINAGFYVVGSKSQLKEMGLIEGGLFNKKRLNTKGFDTSVFTQIDIREVTEIPLGSKDAKILSAAPESSYELVKNVDKTLTLRILNQSEFWSLSKYLVVMI